MAVWLWVVVFGFALRCCFMLLKCFCCYVLEFCVLVFGYDEVLVAMIA